MFFMVFKSFFFFNFTEIVSVLLFSIGYQDTVLTTIYNDYDKQNGIIEGTLKDIIEHILPD